MEINFESRPCVECAHFKRMQYGFHKCLKFNGLSLTGTSRATYPDGEDSCFESSDSNE